MRVTSAAIVNGEFEDKYGKRGGQFSPNGMPTYSVPFEISGAPEGTKSFAVVLEDKDAITASGFVWIHWLIADLERTSVAENDSISATDYVQGANSWASVLGKLSIEEASRYGGMAPPNCRPATNSSSTRSIPNSIYQRASASTTSTSPCRATSSPARR